MKVQRPSSSSADMLLFVALLHCSLAIVETGHVVVSKYVGEVIVAINEQQNRRICGDHSANNAAVLRLCLEGRWPFVYKGAVSAARDERRVNVP